MKVGSTWSREEYVRHVEMNNNGEVGVTEEEEEEGEEEVYFMEVSLQRYPTENWIQSRIRVINLIKGVNLFESLTNGVKDDEVNRGGHDEDKDDGDEEDDDEEEEEDDEDDDDNELESICRSFFGRKIIPSFGSTTSNEISSEKKSSVKF
jgi:ribosomal protein L12E/L44/L45/RPP1/RPP2